VPTIAAVPCGDMVASYEHDEVTGDVRLTLSPAATTTATPEKHSGASDGPRSPGPAADEKEAGSGVGDG
jgi:hypothetical protein